MLCSVNSGKSIAIVAKEITERGNEVPTNKQRLSRTHSRTSRSQNFIIFHTHLNSTLYCIYSFLNISPIQSPVNGKKKTFFQTISNVIVNRFLSIECIPILKKESPRFLKTQWIFISSLIYFIIYLLFILLFILSMILFNILLFILCLFYYLLYYYYFYH